VYVCVYIYIYIHTRAHTHTHTHIYMCVFMCVYVCVCVCVCVCVWAGIAQSVKRLATGWTIRGSKSGGRRDFPHPSRPILGISHPPIQWVPGLSRGVKRPGPSVDHSPPYSAKVKERVELYLYSPSESSWSVLG